MKVCAREKPSGLLVNRSATRVLCTYGASFGGGILRVITEGLPYLKQCANLDIVVADLYNRDEIHSLCSRLGVKSIGLAPAGRPYATSATKGVLRKLGLLRSVPRHVGIAYRLKRQSETADVLYVHTYKELVLARCSHLPTVWHCHGFHHARPFIRQLALRCTTVIAISSAVARGLVNAGVPSELIKVVPNVVDVREIRRAARSAPKVQLPVRGERSVVVLPTSSLRAIKGIVPLLLAARYVKEIEVWITGDLNDVAGQDEIRGFLRLSEDEQLRGRVKFIGFRRDIYSVMLAADIVCVPSICEEGFGLVAAEAMALGMPVIVSDRGGLPEIVQHTTTGLVVDVNNEASFASAIKELATNRAFALGLGAAAMKAADEWPSYERWAYEVASVLRSASTG